MFARTFCWEKSAWGKGSNPHLTCLSASCDPCSTVEHSRRSPSTLWGEIFQNLMETLGVVPKLAVGAHMITCADFKKRIDYDFQNEAPQELVMDFEDLKNKKKPKASSVKTCKPMKSKASSVKTCKPMKSKASSMKTCKPMKSKAAVGKTQLKKPAATKKQYKGKK